MMKPPGVQGETPRPANACKNEWRESPFLWLAQFTGLYRQAENLPGRALVKPEKGWWS